MLVEPGVQVNPVIDTAPSETHMGHVQLRQQRDPNAQVQGRLFL